MGFRLRLLLRAIENLIWRRRWRTAPTGPGYYWVRTLDDSAEPHIVLLIPTENGLYVSHLMNTFHGGSLADYNSLCTFWIGPLKKPRDAGHSLEEVRDACYLERYGREGAD
jgi:hypothetical protein